MDRQYLIPANSKKSQLILGFFNKIDIAVFGTGIAFTLIFLFFLDLEGIPGLIISLLPVIITGFLVLPVPHYHNVMTLIGNVWKYLTGRKNYYWRGWCVNYETRDKR